MWYSPATLHLTIPSAMREWLTDEGSLVLRLRAAGATQPRVTVLHQTWTYPLADERDALRIPHRCYALIREILISNADQPLIFARTIFPKQTLTGPQRLLGHLGTRTLGSVLFKHPQLTRSDFEVAYIKPAQSWHRHIATHHPIHEAALWARRSQFFIKQKPMLVTEVFLPAFSALVFKDKAFIAPC
jgi:chorismate--pyruvate lyase